jgi:hypothetical protein
MRRGMSFAFFFVLLVHLVNARIHDLIVTDDPRPVFGIEYFAFSEGGSMRLKLEGFKVRRGGG